MLQPHRKRPDPLLSCTGIHDAESSELRIGCQFLHIHIVGAELRDAGLGGGDAVGGISLPGILIHPVGEIIRFRNAVICQKIVVTVSRRVHGVPSKNVLRSNDFTLASVGQSDCFRENTQ